MNEKQLQCADIPNPWGGDRIRVALAAARHYAARAARRRRLTSQDREDLTQDILLVLVERAHRFDPARGSWDAFAALIARHAVADRVRAQRSAHAVFVDLELDDLPAGTSATQHDRVDPDLALDLARVGTDMPAPSGRLLDLIRTTRDVAVAQRHAPGSCAGFYRAMSELRCWLHAAGLRPTRATPARAPRAVPP